MKILLIRTSKAKSKWADIAVENWKKRFISKIPFEEIVCKPAPAHYNIQDRQQQESKKVKSLLRYDDFVILLDERGEFWSTEELHKKINGAMNSSVKRMVFVIGGPFGHAPFLRKESKQVLSLSKMVLNHEIARICLVEQIYRVYTLIYGGDYHH